MKTINVVAAIIEKDDKILIAKRSYGDFEGQWEFPGGKVEEDESKEDALLREIKEELNIEITIKDYLMCAEYQYPNFYLKMDCYICNMANQTLTLVDHSAIKWINPLEKSAEITWIPADIQVIEKYVSYINS